MDAATVIITLTIFLVLVGVATVVAVRDARKGAMSVFRAIGDWLKNLFELMFGLG
ncbi:MAG: hypothetical protein R3F22_06105 [Lysobacteraceae bacterium]